MVAELKEKDIQGNLVCKKVAVAKVVVKVVDKAVVICVADVEREEVNLQPRPSHKLL